MKSDTNTAESSALSAARRLREAGYLAYFAGGCVRDRILGREPKDYDIATNATPEQAARLFPGAHTVGAHFGVVLVRVGGEALEIATFRTDGSYRDGRRPESVSYSTPEEDAQRRDFTINGLFYDPDTDTVIDFVGGQADLKAGVLRAIGDPAARFAEDRLRLMRAVRFAVTTGFTIDPATWQAMCDAAPSLGEISIERIREEFSRILLHPDRVRGLDLLDSSGMLSHILPPMAALKGCTQPPQFHPEGDVWVHTRLMLSLLPAECSLPLVLSVLLHDIGKPATWSYDEEAGRIRFNGHESVGAEMTEELLKRLRYSNDIVERTKEAVQNHMKFMHVKDMRTARLKQFVAREHFADELALHRVDCLGSNGRLENYQFIQDKLAEYAAAPVIPPRLLNGHDLMQAGYPGGRGLGDLISAVQDAQLENVIATREEALAWVLAHYPLPS